MFPGFVSGYKDKEKFIHLYFFPGITDNGDIIYKKLNLDDCQFKYKEIVNNDGSFEYVFENKSIIKISCSLIRKDNNKLDMKIINLR